MELTRLTTFGISMGGVVQSPPPSKRDSPVQGFLLFHFARLSRPPPLVLALYVGKARHYGRRRSPQRIPASCITSRDKR